MFIHFDISGIQNFIYNIISKGALKNLRSRSFFIELLSHHAERKLLQAFGLHQANIIMNGGGSMYILAGKPENYEQKLLDIDVSLNSWLLEEFNTLLHVSFVAVETSREELSGNLENRLAQLSHKIVEGKNQKFLPLIKNTEGNKADFSFISTTDPSTHQCDLCGNDRQGTDLVMSSEIQDQYTCSFCDNLIRLGNKLPESYYFYPSDQPCNDSIQIQDTWYILSKTPLPGRSCSLMYPQNSPDFFTAMPEQGIIRRGKSYIRKIADLKHIKDAILQEHHMPGTGDDSPLFKETDMAQLTHLAQAVGKGGAHYIGALRMDADNMGKLMRQGFYDTLNAHRLASFSRQVNYFFKLTFPGLCAGKNVQLIYAGGDDLFLVGAWNDVLDIALRAGNHFSEYTCNNIDMGISAGFTIHDGKFPVNTMARVSLKALETAKRNLLPCWQCREDVSSCPLYADGACLRKDSFSPFYTDWYAHLKSLLDEKIKVPYQEVPSRLVLALKWKIYNPEYASSTGESLIYEVKEYLEKPFGNLNKYKEKIKKTRGFFHKVLALLNTWYEEGVMYLPRIAWLLQKIRGDLTTKGPGEDKENPFVLYDQYLHLFDPSRFATLHMPLHWLILSEKQGDTHETIQ